MIANNSSYQLFLSAATLASKTCYQWIADYWFVSQPLARSALSFVARIANSYFGPAQWIDLARFTGLQAHNDESDSSSSKRALEGEQDVGSNSDALSTSASSPITQDRASTFGQKAGNIDQLKEKKELPKT